MKKKLIILIGPKGSGKSSIGAIIEQKTHIKFLRVEPIWLSLKPEEDGWQRVAAEIDRQFQENETVMIESLGVGEGFDKLHTSLKERYEVKLVKVEADLALCLSRVKNRDSSNHIPVSDDKVEEYNRIAVKVSHAWDAIIDNNEPATEAEILEIIASV